MDHKEDFGKELRFGNVGEQFIKEFLEQKGAKFINYNNDNKYDIKMLYNNEEITYEIKTDRFKSGNLFIEYNSRDKDSGIETSEAKWLVNFFINLNEIWFIKTDDIKKLINENNFKQILGGDNDSSIAYLIPKNRVKEHFIVFNTKGDRII